LLLLGESPQPKVRTATKNRNFRHFGMDFSNT